MTNADLSNSLEAGLLGVEIGRNKVRLALLDEDGKFVVDMVERPIAKAGGPRNPIEQEASTRAALEAALGRLGYVPGQLVLAAATIGFANCGVGSGPALRGWLASLSDELEEPLICSGIEGISYAPALCVDLAHRMFEQLGIQLDRVELAPVAACRVIGHLASGTLTLGSGIAWSARVLNDQVLEAFEAGDGPFDDVLHLVANGLGSPLTTLAGIDVDESVCRNRGLSVPSLAPAAGVALSLLSDDGTNLLDGETITGAAASAPAPAPSRRSRGAAPEWSPSNTDPSNRVSLYGTPTHAHRERSGSVPRIDDTYQLSRSEDARPIGRIRSSYEPERPLERTPGDMPVESDGIEAFAHPDGDLGSGRPFSVRDFLLGAFGMLAIVLIITLVVL